MKSLVGKIIITAICAIFSIALIVGDTIAYSHHGEITSHLSPATEIVDETKVEEANAAGEEVVQQIAAEGITLLKNNGTLPLSMPEDDTGYPINLFGVGATKYFYSGIGSGASRPRQGKGVNMQQALTQAGFVLNDDLIKAYSNGNFDVSAYDDPDEVLRNAKTFSKTALVAISRQTGENQQQTELTTDTTEPIGGISSGYYDTDADGRNPVQLSLKEEAMLDWVCANFENVIVTLNVGNTMEMGYMDRDEVDALLHISHPGQSGAVQLANILTGKTNPSGHLSDTFAYNTKADPTWANVIAKSKNGWQINYAEDIYFGYKWYETAFAEGVKLTVNDGEKDVQLDFSTEDGYKKIVQYPFGYGLSYTTFDWEVRGMEWIVDDSVSPASSGDTLADRDTTIRVTVRVTNTGDVPGKDAVQLYYSAPYTDGGIEKAAVNLTAFAKTGMLYPEGYVPPAEDTSDDENTAMASSETGGTEEETPEEPSYPTYEDVVLEFDVYDMASYDCYDDNGNGFTGWELDPGEYKLLVKDDAHNMRENMELTVKVPNTGSAAAPMGFQFLFDPDTRTGIVYNRFTGSSAEAGVPIDGNGNGGEITYMSRADFAGTFPRTTTPARVSGADITKDGGYYTGWDTRTDLVKPQLNNTSSNLLLFTLEGGGKPTKEDLRRESGNTIVINEELVMKLGADYDAPEWTQLLSQLSIEEIDYYVTSGGYGTQECVSIGKPLFLVHDGPSGFNRGMTQFGSPQIYTNFPVENLVAMTWNTDLARQQGSAIGVEAQATGEAGIYAPTVNLHRHAYNTRNFEAYSEDGVLSGYMGGAMIYGARTHGAQTSLKHFVLSEPGKNPSNYNTWLTEQNLRENYLKAFEIAVKTGGANFVMTAFNNVGGVKCAYSYQLLNGVLRQEWGFKGSVVTDYGVGNADSLIRAGNDLKLNPNTGTTGLSEDNVADVYCGVQAVKNDLYTFCNTYYSAKTYNPSMTYTMVSRDQPFIWWIPTLIGINIVIFGIAIFLILWMWLPRKRRKAKAVAEVAASSDAAQNETDYTLAFAADAMPAVEDIPPTVAATVAPPEPKEPGVSGESDESADFSAPSAMPLTDAYNALPDDQKHRFEQIRLYAENKAGAVVKETQAGVSVKIGGKPLVKLKLRRGVIVASFRYETSEMKEYRKEMGVELHDTVIKVRDDASLASAYRMTDKMIELYEREKEEAKQRRREARRKKRDDT